MNRLTDAELAEASLNLAKARTSLECEGLVLTDDEEALFRQFEVERLPHEESRRRIVEFCRRQRERKVHAAE
jgi:hypothetical protein